jgi:pyruvate,orthophosphate dikinase
MIAAEGVLTSRGGKTSHAAVVARGMGKTCVCGAEELDVDTKVRRIACPDGSVITEGDVISIDGSTGEVFLGAVPVVPSPVVEYFEGRLFPTDDDDLVTAVDRLMQHGDAKRRLAVRANADTPDDAARARRMGAAGIGLCRTEHMFLGERRQHVERLILATTPAKRDDALATLLPLQRADFVGILAAMDALPVTIRLIDPPLHEFLPDITELSVRVALNEAKGVHDDEDARLLAAVRRLHETNPMLGLRGVRLGLVTPGLFAMQVRAIAQAAAARIKAGGDPKPEIMIPLVGAVQELETVREEAVRVVAEVAADAGVTLNKPPTSSRSAPTTSRRRRGRSAATTSKPRSSPATSTSASSASLRSRRSTAAASDAWCGWPARKAVRQSLASSSASAASTAATPNRSTSSTRSGSTTCRAHRSASPWRGSRPGERP